MMDDKYTFYLLIGDGTQLVALSHVDDVASIIAAAVGNEKAHKQVHTPRILGSTLPLSCLRHRTEHDMIVPHDMTCNTT